MLIMNLLAPFVPDIPSTSVRMPLMLKPPCVKVRRGTVIPGELMAKYVTVVVVVRLGLKGVSVALAIVCVHRDHDAGI